MSPGYVTLFIEGIKVLEARQVHEVIKLTRVTEVTEDKDFIDIAEYVQVTCFIVVTDVSEVIQEIMGNM